MPPSGSMRHSAVRNCIDCASMKRSLRLCALGAETGAAAATGVASSSAAAAPALPRAADLLLALAADCDLDCGALALEDGLALALLVCFGLSDLLVRAPAGASAKLVSRKASASFV